MKIKFPREGFQIICEKCYRPIYFENDSSEDGDMDFLWCENCIDYRSGKFVKVLEV